MKSKYKFLVLFLCLFVLHSCKKDKEPLFGISIDTQKMVKTPAEIFSLQHIEFFRASNDFVLSILPSFMEKNDSLKTTSFAVSPFFLHFTLAKDSTFNEYLSGFENHYQLSAMSQKERTKFFNSFLESVSEIDSSIHIISEIKTSSVDSICVYQKFQFQTHYKDSFSSTYHKRKIFEHLRGLFLFGRYGALSCGHTFGKRKLRTYAYKTQTSLFKRILTRI